MLNSHYPIHLHADTEYYLNNSEFLLEGEIEYDVLSGAVVDPNSADFKLGFDEQVKDNIMKAYNTGKQVTKAKLPIKVSAYAIWRAWATYTKKNIKYTVNATNRATGEKLQAVGTFNGVQYSSTKAEYEEKAAPGADGHYSPGHGTDAHGSQANAGGGIIYSE